MIHAQRFTFLIAIISWVVVAIVAPVATAIAGIPSSRGDTTAVAEGFIDVDLLF